MLTTSTIGQVSDPGKGGNDSLMYDPLDALVLTLGQAAMRRNEALARGEFVEAAEWSEMIDFFGQVRRQVLRRRAWGEGCG